MSLWFIFLQKPTPHISWERTTVRPHKLIKPNPKIRIVPMPKTVSFNPLAPNYRGGPLFCGKSRTVGPCCQVSSFPQLMPAMRHPIPGPNRISESPFYVHNVDFGASCSERPLPADFVDQIHPLPATYLLIQPRHSTALKTKYLPR